MPTSPHQTDLFDRLLQSKLSPAEAEELIALLANDQSEPHIAELLRQHLQRPHHQDEVSEGVAALEARLQFILSNTMGQPTAPVPFYRRVWVRYASAAAILLLVLGTWLFTQKSTSPNPMKVAPPVATTPILPGRQGAILTLDDGRTIVLDSLKNGLVATQNGSTVVLNDGRLTYDKGKVTTGVTYNTMTTPKGRQFQLLLPDGTKVWLDAASSVRYPTAFAGSERKVEVSGEAYFEVAKNAAMPFKVSIKDCATEIRVLGTHFNINAYGNEASINTTLLEGSLKVRHYDQEVLIKPGQQAQAGEHAAGQQLKVVSNVNLQKVMAWKEGVFDFGDATLQEVMRQLERWYDIEVVYQKGVPPLEFVGKMSRDLSLPDVLHGLEMSEVHFSIDGRKLLVKP